MVRHDPLPVGTASLVQWLLTKTALLPSGWSSKARQVGDWSMVPWLTCMGPLLNHSRDDMVWHEDTTEGLCVRFLTRSALLSTAPAEKGSADNTGIDEPLWAALAALQGAQDVCAAAMPCRQASKNSSAGRLSKVSVQGTSAAPADLL